MGRRCRSTSPSTRSRARANSPGHRRCSFERVAVTSGVDSVNPTNHVGTYPRHQKVDEIVGEVQSYDDADHVVLTGGEPLVHDESVTLLKRLDDLGYHTTVETNGTIYRDVPLDRKMASDISCMLQ